MSGENGHDLDEQQRARQHERAIDKEGASEAAISDAVAPPSYPTSLLSDSRLGGRANSPARAAVVQRMQQTIGNKQTRRAVQRAAATQSRTSDNQLSQRIQGASGAGSTLEAPVQEKLEMGLGADMSGVRVHTGSEADNLAKSVDAVAFTTGSDIFFRDGTYNPDSSEGMRLLAHEAAHTVQQAQGPVEGTPAEGGVAISDPGDSFERAADQAADHVMSAQSSVSSSEAAAPASSNGSVQRTIQRSASAEASTEEAPVPGWLQPAPAAPTEGDLRTSVDEARERSSGEALSNEQRVTMEQSLGQDLSGVRVHADEAAKDLTGAVGARAATIGEDIYLAPGEKDSGQYKELLAHEVTHVAQTGGEVGQGPLLSTPGSVSEQQANQASSSVAAGQAVTVSRMASSPTVQRAMVDWNPTNYSYVQLTLNSQGIIDFCRQKAGNVTGVFSDSPLWNQCADVEADIVSAVGGNYFKSQASWRRHKHYDPGIMHPNYDLDITIRLKEDGQSAVGGGATATVGTQANSGTSGQQTQGVTNTAGGEASASGGEKDKWNVGGKATGSSSTTATDQSGQTGGSQTSGSQQSQTVVMTSNIIAHVDVQVSQSDRLAEYHHWGGSSDIAAGNARYTMPTQQAVPAAPAPAGGGGQ